MAIDVIHEVFPGVQADWERTPRVRNGTMTADETTSGDEIAAIPQRDMSDDCRGPGVEELKRSLQDYCKKQKQQNAQQIELVF